MAAPALGPRQQRIVDLIIRGYRTREIARDQGISERAVTAHVTRLMKLYEAGTRAELIAAIMASGPSTPPGSAIEEERARYLDAPFLVAVTRGSDHVFTFVNAMWERVMDLRSADVLGRTVREVFPNASPTTYAARQRAYREGHPTSGNAWHYRWATRDGTQREADFRFIYQPLRSSAGTIEGLLLIASESPEGDAV